MLGNQVNHRMELVPARELSRSSHEVSPSLGIK